MQPPSALNILLEAGQGKVGVAIKGIADDATSESFAQEIPSSY